MEKTIRIQHGDVQGFTVNSVPTGARRIENKPIALGETHGHAHVVTGDVELFELDGILFAAVGKDGATLSHTFYKEMKSADWVKNEPLRQADHKPIPLSAGVYEFFIQNSYNPYSKLMEKVID